MKIQEIQAGDVSKTKYGIHAVRIIINSTKKFNLL